MKANENMQKAYEEIEKTMPKLKPCPFCGGNPEINLHPIVRGEYDCNLICRCDIRTDYFEEIEELCEFWNTRVKNRGK